jgi:hypothetical protein
MYAYGDESGHLRNLLNGNCDVFVLAIVAGEQYDCSACPKQAVRRITDLEEAKWKNLTTHQKRRVVDCFADQERDLSYGYIALSRSDLQELDESYLLYQDRAFERDWDLSVIGYGYAHMLKNVISNKVHINFTFDRIFGRAQSNQVAQTIRQTDLSADIQHKSSHSTRGIQAADCIAGLVAEAYRGRSKWINKLHEQMAELSCDFVGVLDDDLLVQK